MSKKIVWRQISRENTVIKDVVEALKDTDNLMEANRYFCELCESVSGFEKLSSNVYRYKDFFINIGKRVFMAVHAEGLRIVADLGLSCLPELAAYVWLDNDEDMVLITRVKDSFGQHILPFKGEYQLTDALRQELLADADRLMESGYTVASLIGDRSDWYILEDCSAVIFSNCKLVDVPQKAKPAFRMRLLEELCLN